VEELNSPNNHRFLRLEDVDMDKKGSRSVQPASKGLTSDSKKSQGLYSTSKVKFLFANMAADAQNYVITIVEIFKNSYNRCHIQTRVYAMVYKKFS
jgi:hypothetical protein